LRSASFDCTFRLARCESYGQDRMPAMGKAKSISQAIAVAKGNAEKMAARAHRALRTASPRRSLRWVVVAPRRLASFRSRSFIAAGLPSGKVRTGHASFWARRRHRSALMTGEGMASAGLGRQGAAQVSIAPDVVDASDARPELPFFLTG